MRFFTLLILSILFVNSVEAGRKKEKLLQAVTSGNSVDTKAKGNEDATKIRQFYIAFRTTPETNKVLYKEFLKGVGISDETISRGHLTYAWVKDIAEEDLLPLTAYMEAFISQLDLQKFTFKMGLVGRYTHQREPGKEPIILFPEDPAPFIELNQLLSDHIKGFKGSKSYVLDVGTAPEDYVPHITLANEKVISTCKIDTEKTIQLLNAAIEKAPQTFTFSENILTV